MNGRCWYLTAMDGEKGVGGFLLELASGSLVVGERLQNPANAWNGRCSVVERRLFDVVFVDSIKYRGPFL